MVLLLFWLVAFVINVNGIIVDDTSDLLFYSNQPTWNTGSASQPAAVIKWPGNSRGSANGGTWHEALNYMCTVRFTFTGTAISVYGIVPTVRYPTRLGFTIDGGEETMYNKEVTDLGTQVLTQDQFDYGVQVFTIQGLSPSGHTLALSTYFQAALFGLDYIEYTPAEVATTTSANTRSAPSASQNTTNTQTTGVTTTTNSAAIFTSMNGLPAISTNAPGTDTTVELPTILPSDPRIVYSSPQQWISSTSCGMSSMVTVSSGAFLSFNFTGPSIWIYTAMNPQGGRYEVSIDGNPKGFFNTAGSTCKAQALYRVDNLDGPIHTLAITNVITSVSTNFNGEIDFLGFRLAGSENQGVVPTSAVVGGVLGGAAVLALLVFGVYWGFLRQRRGIHSKELVVAGHTQPFPSPQEPFPVPLSEKQRLAGFESATPIFEQTNRIAYQTYLKPRLVGDDGPPSRQSPGGSDGTPSSYFTNTPTQEEEARLTHSTAPPSFRTRPITAQYQHGPAPSVGSHKSLDVGPADIPLPSARSSDGREWSADQSNPAPPYVEDVLARSDARNLSENDVDAIARRLAGVMQINNAARSGPGLLRGAPPRELIDQLVEDHLAAREDFN